MIVIYSILLGITILCFLTFFGLLCSDDVPPDVTPICFGFFVLFLIFTFVAFDKVESFSKENVESSEVIENYVIHEYDKGIAIVVGGDFHKYETFAKTELIRKKEFTVYKQTFTKSKASEIKRTECKIFNFKGEEL